jgi:hypothetical protein
MIVGDLDILAVHKGIVAVVNAHVLQLDVLAIPQIFFTIREIGVLHIDAIRTTEEFGRIHLAVGHTAVA